MKKVFVIGIGAGNPDYITIQAINALNQVDVFYVFDKGEAKNDLIRLRKEICNRFIKDEEYRFVEVRSPTRDATVSSYKADVESWHREKAEIFKSLIKDEMNDGECAAFLTWGDPSLYDSTLRILQHVRAEGPLEFDYEVIPGISSIQALAAQHKVPLNTIGESIHITTGRKLAEGLPNNSDSIVVLLDSGTALRAAESQDVVIYWGAYLGTEDEILVSGKLSEVAGDIERIRRQAKAEKGWIMDTYLLRRIS
ncbi:MAG: precorrin-6A synthase (deacetylating) [Hyphomicrobium sp.]